MDELELYKVLLGRLMGYNPATSGAHPTELQGEAVANSGQDAGDISSCEGVLGYL